MKLRFLNKKEEGFGVWSFFFEPQEKIEWLAGQSIRLELPRPTFGVDEKRFTISAAPYEKNIRITTKLSGSTFKKSLGALKPGTLIDAHSIEGDFIWHDGPKLFLAGGIGVTPFKSLLKQATFEGKKLNTLMINSDKNDAHIFKDELNDLTKQDSTLQILYINHRIDLKDVENFKDWKNHNVYISGPEKMVFELSKKLISAGLPKRRIKQDLFTGNLFL